jgi:hypothetical protein
MVESVCIVSIFYLPDWHRVIPFQCREVHNAGKGFHIELNCVDGGELRRIVRAKAVGKNFRMASDHPVFGAFSGVYHLE